MSLPIGPCEMHLDADQHALETCQTDIGLIRCRFGMSTPIVKTDEFAQMYSEHFHKYKFPLVGEYNFVREQLNRQAPYRTMSLGINPSLFDVLEYETTYPEMNQILGYFNWHKNDECLAPEKIDYFKIANVNARCDPEIYVGYFHDNYKNLSYVIRDDVKYCASCDDCGIYKKYFDMYIEYYQSLEELMKFVRSREELPN